MTQAVLALAAGNLVNRLLGTAYRLLLVRFLGGEGLGLFQLALSAYFALVQPFAGSLPAALSQVLAAAGGGSGLRPEERRVLATTAALSVLLALAAAWALTQLPPALLGEGWRVGGGLLALPLLHATLACAVVAAALRGLLLARGRTAAIALAQTGEQAARILALGAVLAAAVPADLALRVRLVLWNLLLGEAVDLLLLLGAAARVWSRPWPLRPRAHPPTLAAVARLAVPIAAQRAFFALEHLLEAVLVPAVLRRSGMSSAEALAAYGAVAGVAGPLLYLPMMGVGALAQVLVPEVAALGARPAARARRVRRALGAAAEVGGATAVALLLAGPELARWLYGGDAAGPLAAQAVRALAPVAAFLYLDVTAAAALRGAGHPTQPLLVDLAAALLRLGLLLAAGGAGAGLPGVAGALVASTAFACSLDVWLAAQALRLGPGLLPALALPGACAAAASALVAALPGLPAAGRLAVGLGAYAALRLLAAARGRR